MKVKSTLISVLVMLFCWSASFADTEPDNNTPAGADPIALNGSVSGTAGAINDNSDWYVFTTNADGNITLTLTNDGAYTYLYLYDSDGATLIVTQSGYPGAGGITLQANGLGAGTYYIQVYNINGVSNYTLTNTLTPDPLANDNEPNDVYTQAKTLPLNGDKTGHIDYRYNGNVYDNNDWYKVTTTSDGNLSVNLTNDPGNYIYLYLYDIDGTTLLATTSGYPGASGITMTRTGLSEGLYYVLVYGINGYSGYTLSNVLTPDPYANDDEPNDDYTTANPVPVNDSTQGHIDYFRNGNTYDNHDWYSITTTNDGTIDLNLTNTPGNYVYLYLVDNDGTTIINSTSGYPGSSGIHMTTVGLAAGTYYIDVLGQDGYSGYTLTNSLTTDGISNDVEPNNTPATALPIAENSTVTGHIDYRFNGGTHDNNDYYQLTTTTDGSITVTLTNSTGTYTYIYLYDADGVTLLGSNSGYPGTVTLTVPGLAAGTYYIRVLGQDGRSGYTLTNTVTPPVYANDVEPNNDFASASNILSTDTVTGHIDFRYNGGIFDNYDYWQSNNCLPGDITASVTDDNGKYVYLFLYNSSFGLITSNSGYGGTSVSALTQPAGTYYFVVYATDGATSYQLTTNLASSTPPLTVSLSATGATCGNANGSINATPAGGTTPYSYMWSNGATTQDISGLSGGTYTITVMDANGCSASKSTTVSQTTAIVLSETHTNVLCNGGANGSINLTTSGAVGPYSYTWSNGATTEDISGLTAGVYAVTVTDQTTCTANLSVTITEPSAISISQTVTSPSCNGNNNGAIDVTVSGGTSPYTYSWSNGAGTQDITGIGAGSYTVTVTDNNGCSKNKTISVSEPAVLSATETHTDVTTNGGNDGSINVTVSGGTTPYSYNWSNGASSQDLNNLTSGTYSLTVTDAHGCTASLSVIINEPGCNLSLSTTQTNVSCAGGNDGSIDLTVSGGTTPYTYAWSNGAGTQDISGIGTGSYTVTVTDNNGCTKNKTISITEPAILAASENHTNVTTNGGSDGSIDVTVTGGTEPYTYDWSNGASTQDLNNLSAGTFTLNVTDAHGCTTSLSVTITEPGNACNLVVTTTHTDVSCAGNSDGTIAVNVMNAQEPVTYTWSDGGPNSAIRTDLSAGNYEVVITDANGCNANASITIGIVASATVSIESYDSGTECNMGKINFLISEGEAPYTIQLYQDGMPYGTPVTTSDAEYTFTDLGNGEYYASVYSSGAGTECASNSGNAIIMPIPQDLTVVDITATSGLVTWTPLPCMEQYRVYYRATGHPENTIMIKVDDNSGMLLLTDLKPDTKFKVKIQSVDLTDWKNVSKQSVTAKFKTLPLRLAEQAAISAKLTVFPNPAISSVNVSFMNGSEGEVSITLLDVTGRILLAQQKIEVSGMVTEELDLSAVSAGVYQLVVISADGIRMNQSIVKVKE